MYDGFSTQNFSANDVGDFLRALDETKLDEVRGLKAVNFAGNRIGYGNEDMDPIHTLLTTSSGSITAINLNGYVELHYAPSGT